MLAQRIVEIEGVMKGQEAMQEYQQEMYTMLKLVQAKAKVVLCSRSARF